MHSVDSLKSCVPVMSPLFISSLRHPPTPGTFVGSSDGAVDLIRNYGRFTSYAPEGSDDHTDESDDSMSMPRLETPSPLGPVYESAEYDAPPSTQPRPVDRDLFGSLPSAEDARRREWSMDQFVCFVYRDSAVRRSVRSRCRCVYSCYVDMVASVRRHGRNQSWSCDSPRSGPIHDPL